MEGKKGKTSKIVRVKWKKCEISRNYLEKRRKTENKDCEEERRRKL